MARGVPRDRSRRFLRLPRLPSGRARVFSALELVQAARRALRCSYVPPGARRTRECRRAHRGETSAATLTGAICTPAAFSGKTAWPCTRRTRHQKRAPTRTPRRASKQPSGSDRQRRFGGGSLRFHTGHRASRDRDAIQESLFRRQCHGTFSCAPATAPDRAIRECDANRRGPATAALLQWRRDPSASPSPLVRQVLQPCLTVHDWGSPARR